MKSNSDLLALRLDSQLLVPKSGGSVAEVVRGVGGVQAQEIAAGVWSIGTRSDGLTAEDVNRARNDERSIILTWAMRGTRHFVATEDIGWLLPLLAPRFIHANQRRYRELGLSESLFEQAVPLMRNLVGEHGATTRGEIGAMLNQAGISTDGQRLIHLISRATLEGVLCFGPDRTGDETWVVLDEWVKVEWEPDRIDKLVRRYFGAFAPATVDDFAAWSGLLLTTARHGVEQIAEELIEVESDAGTMWTLRDSAHRNSECSDVPTVRFLPRYDTCLLGYQSRSWLVDEPFAKRIHPGGGVLHATLLVNGRAAGSWKSGKQGKRKTLTVLPFEPLPPRTVRAIEQESLAMARFRGTVFTDLDFVIP